MARVVVFGTGQIAEVAWFYLTHDSEHEVVAFTVDRAYLDRDTFHDLPVVAFEDITTLYPPDQYQMFVSISYQQVNRLREAKYHAAKAKGYTLISYVSSRATLWPGAVIGDNCFIFEDNTIQPFTRIGNNIVMWSGNHLGHHSVIDDHAFISSHVVISGSVHIGSHCFLGVNASIRDNIKLGSATVVGMGAMVVKSTEAGDVLLGTPARRLEKKSHELERI
jgi:sugar O-acyltransferase (sialic acid O-acetyltransferase NeuD family)